MGKNYYCSSNQKESQMFCKCSTSASRQAKKGNAPSLITAKDYKS